jgi:hypothetical protein
VNHTTEIPQGLTYHSVVENHVVVLKNSLTECQAILCTIRVHKCRVGSRSKVAVVLIKQNTRLAWFLCQIERERAKSLKFTTYLKKTIFKSDRKLCICTIKEIQKDRSKRSVMVLENDERDGNVRF